MPKKKQSLESLFEAVQPGQKPNQYDSLFHVPIYYVPDGAPGSAVAGSYGEYKYDPAAANHSQIALTPAGQADPNILNHELMHHLLTTGAGIPTKSAWYQTVAANPMLGTQYQGAEGAEALPAALFGGYGVQDYPADVRQELRKTALNYVNSNYGADTAYDINRLAQTNRLLPEVVKPISPPKNNMKPVSLFQAMFGR